MSHGPRPHVPPPLGTSVPMPWCCRRTPGAPLTTLSRWSTCKDMAAHGVESNPAKMYLQQPHEIESNMIPQHLAPGTWPSSVEKPEPEGIVYAQLH